MQAGAWKRLDTPDSITGASANVAYVEPGPANTGQRHDGAYPVAAGMSHDRLYGQRHAPVDPAVDREALANHATLTGPQTQADC